MAPASLMTAWATSSNSFRLTPMLAASRAAASALATTRPASRIAANSASVFCSTTSPHSFYPSPLDPILYRY